MPFEKVQTNMDRYANTSGGTIPIILDETLKNKGLEKGIYYCLPQLVPVGLGEQGCISIKSIFLFYLNTFNMFSNSTFLITGIADKHSLAMSVAKEIIRQGGKNMYWIGCKPIPFKFIR